MPFREMQTTGEEDGDARESRAQASDGGSGGNRGPGSNGRGPGSNGGGPSNNGDGGPSQPRHPGHRHRPSAHPDRYKWIALSNTTMGAVSYTHLTLPTNREV